MDLDGIDDFIANLPVQDREGLLATLLEDSSDEEADENGQQGAHIASHAGAVAMMDMARRFVHNEPLINAASHGDIPQLMQFLQNNADINARDGLQETALYAAVCHDHLDAVELLLRAGANPDLPCSQEWAALHATSRSGNDRIASLLLQWKADPNVRDSLGWTPLHVASLYGNHNIVTILLAGGADVNSRGNDLRAPIHTAVDFGHEEVIRELALHGAILDVQDDVGETPLHISVMARPFLSPALVLLRLGANPNLQNIKGNTPLHIAINSSLDPAVGMIPLLRYGADVDVANNEGYTPLLYAIHRFKNDFEKDRLKSLLDVSADINSIMTTKSGQTTPLVWAVDEGNVTAVQLLVENQVDVGLAVERNGIQISPIFHAAANNHLEGASILNILIGAGANPKETMRGRISPIHICALKQNPTCLRVLLENGASPNDTDGFKATPLHIAAREGDLSCVQILLEYGADVNARDRDRSTALHHAVLSKNEEIIKAIVGSNASVMLFTDRNLDMPLGIIQERLREQIQKTEDQEAQEASSELERLTELLEIMLEALANQDPLTRELIDPDMPAGWFRAELSERFSAASREGDRPGPRLEEIRGRYLHRPMAVV